jgi:hypothetical protein
VGLRNLKVNLGRLSILISFSRLSRATDKHPQRLLHIHIRRLPLPQHPFTHRKGTVQPSHQAILPINLLRRRTSNGLNKDTNRISHFRKHRIIPVYQGMHLQQVIIRAILLNQLNQLLSIPISNRMDKPLVGSSTMDRHSIRQIHIIPLRMDLRSPSYKGMILMRLRRLSRLILPYCCLLRHSILLRVLQQGASQAKTRLCILHLMTGISISKAQSGPRRMNLWTPHSV